MSLKTVLYALVPGMKGTSHKRKVRWNPESGLMRIEYLDFNSLAYFYYLGFKLCDSKYFPFFL